jgi:hypothetical protein
MILADHLAKEADELAPPDRPLMLHASLPPPSSTRSQARIAPAKPFGSSPVRRSIPAPLGCGVRSGARLRTAPAAG